MRTLASLCNKQEVRAMCAVLHVMQVIYKWKTSSVLEVNPLLSPRSLKLPNADCYHLQLCTKQTSATF